MKARLSLPLALILAACGWAGAQTESPTTLFWPSSEKPTLKINLEKCQKSGILNGQSIFVVDISAQNVSEQGMPRSVFTVFVADKNGIRIGRARLQLPEIPPFRTDKAQLQFSAAGDPATVSLLAGRTIPLRILSVPPGAKFKVDGTDEGITPKLVDFTIGSHTLEFTKEGYSTGTTPLDVGADELPGGSISFELGGLSKDTIELRDGTSVLGDVISMSLAEVVVNVDGKEQKHERNQVKKMILVERILDQKTLPVVGAHPAANK